MIPTTETLATLARKINSLNSNVVEEMVESGKLLIQVKSRLKKTRAFNKRGGFQDWIRGHLKITPQTAFRYVRLAKSKKPLETYCAQKDMQRIRQAAYDRRKRIAHNWIKMAPLDRAIATFNALEEQERQQFLKWVADQFGEKPVQASTTSRSRRAVAVQDASA